MRKQKIAYGSCLSCLLLKIKEESIEEMLESRSIERHDFMKWAAIRFKYGALDVMFTGYDYHLKKDELNKEKSKEDKQ